MSIDETEAVARALCAEMFGDAVTHGEARCCQRGGSNGCCLEDVRPLAEAAIRAYRQVKEGCSRTVIVPEPMDNLRNPCKMVGGDGIEPPTLSV